jgi:hypothetical protein
MFRVIPASIFLNDTICRSNIKKIEQTNERITETEKENRKYRQRLKYAEAAAHTGKRYCFSEGIAGIRHTVYVD